MGKFEKGQIPHNKGKKLIDYVPTESIEKIKETQFKEGVGGEVHNSWKGGIHEVKDDCVFIWTGVNQRERRPKKIYEENFGPVPEGYIIYHKNGNKHDDSPENLEAISRAELLKRNNSKLK